MNVPDLVLRSRRVVTPKGTHPATVHVTDGSIVHIGTPTDVVEGATLLDVGSLVVMPGIVDTHVHLCEPHLDEWEGFETGTQAAAAGGVTTVVDMPVNNLPPTTTVKGIAAKVEAATARCWVDVGIWGGVVPGNVPELEEMHRWGVLGFMCLLAPSGAEEFPPVEEFDLRHSMPVLTSLGAVLAVHAEHPGPLNAAGRIYEGASEARLRSYQTYLKSRPAAAEIEAVRMMLRLCREYRTPVHILHLAADAALQPLTQARQEWLPVTTETCPHYLTFASGAIPDGATAFKCAPPIRDPRSREHLWRALDKGLIDLIASDHSPSPPNLKCLDSGDFSRARAGISSLQLSLPVVWTEARQRGYPLERLAEWMCAGPARVVGLRRKGSIEVGCDADFAVWDPEAGFRVEPSDLLHRHKVTPYTGRFLRGVVRQTFLRGIKIFDAGELAPRPTGEILRRPKAPAEAPR